MFLSIGEDIEEMMWGAGRVGGGSLWEQDVCFQMISDDISRGQMRLVNPEDQQGQRKEESAQKFFFFFLVSY